MNNQEMKKLQWGVAKTSLLLDLPADYVIVTDGLDDDSKYYHVEIKIDDDFYATAQGDINIEGLYAWRIECRRKNLYAPQFDLEDEAHLKSVLRLWNSNVDVIKKYCEKIYDISSNIDMLSQIRNNIQQYLLSDKLTKEKMTECVNTLYSVKEFIENERLIERFFK